MNWLTRLFSRGRHAATATDEIWREIDRRQHVLKQRLRLLEYEAEVQGREFLFDRRRAKDGHHP